MKKLLVFFSLFFALLVVQAQSQISELQRGLIFRTQLNEWGQGRDEVSGVMPTKTDVYNVQDRSGNGGTRHLIYNGSSSASSFTAIATFGSADFMVTAKIQVGTLGAVRTILGGAANAFDLNISATGYLTAKIMGGSALTASTTLLAASGTYTVSYSRTSTTGTYYVNGVAAGTCTDANNYTVGCTLAGNGTGYFNGSIFMIRAFNWAASVANYSKPEYPIEWVDRIVGTAGAELVTNGSFTGNANGWTLTNFTYNNNNIISDAGGTGVLAESNITILANKKYRFSGYSSQDGVLYFQIPGTPSNPVLTTTSTPTIIISTFDRTTVRVTGGSQVSIVDNVSVVQLGCVLDLNAEGLSQSTSGYWYDRTNSTAASGYTSVAATNSGTTLSIPPASNLGAMAFNGTTSNVVYTGMDGLTGDITISFWYNKLSNGVDYSTLFSNGQLFIYNDNANGALLFVRGVTTSITSNASILSANTWVNVCITSTSTGLTTFYKDGVLWSVRNIQTSTPVSSTSWVFGNRVSGSYYSNGLFESTNIWSRILSQDEITLVKDTGF